MILYKPSSPAQIACPRKIKLSDSEPSWVYQHSDVRALDDYMWMLFEVVDVVMMLERVVWPRNFLMYCDHVVYWADFGWQIPASCPLVRVEWHRSLSELSSPALCVWPKGLSLHDSSVLGFASGHFLPPILSLVAWCRSCFIFPHVCLRDDVLHISSQLAVVCIFPVCCVWWLCYVLWVAIKIQLIYEPFVTISTDITTTCYWPYM